jgi:DNA invertase Pin-like site-specific DNA recombinase
MKVAGYVRVSTEQQKEDGSHVTQRQKLKEWAEDQDAEIELFEDIAISGQSDQREGYDEMMSRLGEFDAVVVRELSRFGRNLRKVLDDVETLDEHGVDFVTLSGEFDTSTAQGKLLLQVKGAFDEFWSNLAQERANEMVQRRREEGKPIGRPKKLNDDELEQVREWREMGLSYSAIASLVEDGFGKSIDQSTIYRYCKEDENEETAQSA